jgi:maleylacetate reductase
MRWPIASRACGCRSAPRIWRRWRAKLPTAFAHWLPRAIAAGVDPEARAQCLAAAWLAGVVLAGGTGLQHKLAHVLGGVGLPHAETHAVILPHVTRFNLAAAPTARARLAAALGGDDPAARLAAMLASLPLPQRLSELGFERGRIEPVAVEIAAMTIALPRPVSGADARALLAAAF